MIRYLVDSDFESLTNFIDSLSLYSQAVFARYTVEQFLSVLLETDSFILFVLQFEDEEVEVVADFLLKFINPNC